MMKSILAAFLFLLLANTSYSQSFNKDDAKALTLNWEVIENSLTAGRQSKSVLTITNNGNKPLPANGWKIFFNSGGFQSADTTVATIKLVNGDLIAITPGSNFGALQAGEAKKVAINGGAIRNITEYPIGFYLSFDDEPNKGYPLSVKMENAVSTEKHDLAIATRIYKQNHQINNIPVDKLTKIFPSPTTYAETTEKFV